MSSSHLSAAPSNPYQWQESVLSTRSLSYLSTADAGSSPNNARERSISNSMRRRPRRQSTEMTDDSDYSLEMAAQQDMELNDIPELPDSVAESPFFVLPREIRDRVYAHCLTADGNEAIKWPAATAKYGIRPQILRTCRRLNEEAVRFLYSLNHMAFNHPSDANMFVRALAAPGLAHHVPILTLHMRWQDNRLWMPYLTSRDKIRSLQADFPHLRELNIRYRSNKWEPTLSAEANLKIWSEDGRLDEVIDGIRNAFFPGLYKKRKNANIPGNLFGGPAAISESRASLDRPKSSVSRPETTIRITCACRVGPNHFRSLTTPAPSTTETMESDHPDLSQANNGTGVIQQTPPTVPAGNPIVAGAQFSGFTPVDLRTATVRKVLDEDGGMASVASTVFADKDGVLLALEIYCLEGKKEGATATTSAAAT